MEETTLRSAVAPVARRTELVAEFARLTSEYEAMVIGGFGCSELGLKIHRLIDRITSDVYGLDFAYCGRTHTVL